MAEVRPAEDSGEIVTFTFFLMAGLFPPFSYFFMEVLGSYQLWMAQLSTNVVLVLAIFAHVCEAFVGVMPSVCIFRRLFRVTLRSGIDAPTPSGLVWFLPRNRHLYIEQGFSDKVDG